jgi:hypothetical protein
MSRDKAASSSGPFRMSAMFNKKQPEDTFLARKDQSIGFADKMRTGAAFSLAFDKDFKPFNIPVDLVCLKRTDEMTGMEYIELSRGRANAPSYGCTEGYSIRLPDPLEAKASGQRVGIKIAARGEGGRRSRFAVAYSTNEVGNSGWLWFTATSDWSIYTMEYNVPAMRDGNGDFIGLLPDQEGSPGTEFSYLSVAIQASR